MRKTILMTVAVCALTVGVTARAQEMKAPEGAAHPPPASDKMALPEKMAPRAPTGAEGPALRQPGKPISGSEKMSPDNKAEPRANADKADKTEPAGEPAAKPTEHPPGGAAPEGKTAAPGKMTSEQRTKVVTEFKSAGIHEAVNINVTNVRVGAAVPREITQYWAPVPATIIEIVPAWRAYRAVVVNGVILIIDPATFEIVYVLD